MIKKYHPTDPDNNKKFNVLDSITVSNYNLKLADAFQCVKIYKILKLLWWGIKKFFIKKVDDKKKVERPKTMADVPDSASSDASDDKNDTFKGLS